MATRRINGNKFPVRPAELDRIARTIGAELQLFQGTSSGYLEMPALRAVALAAYYAVFKTERPAHLPPGVGWIRTDESVDD